MASKQDKAIELAQLWRIIWRRKSLLLLSLISVLCAALIGLQVLPEQFRSEVDISIEEPERLTQDVERVLGRGRTSGFTRGVDERRLGELAGKVTSKQFLERVVRVLSMHKDPRLVEMAREERKKHPSLTVDEIAVRFLVNSLQARIRVSGRGPGLYRISVTDFNPETARALAHWVSELFIDQTTREELDRIQAARVFSQEQLRIYQDELTRSENALKAFQESRIGTALEDNPIRGDNLRLAEEAAAGLLQDERVTRDRVGERTRNAIAGGMPAEDPSLRESPEVRLLANEVTRTLNRLSRLKLTHVSNDPALTAVNSDLVQARNALYRGLEREAQVLYADQGDGDWSVMADLGFAQLDADCHADAASTMKLLILDYKRRVRAEPGNALEVKRLSDGVNRKRDVLESFEKQLLASELKQQVEMSELGYRVEIVDGAQLPLAPYWPDRTKIIMLALLMGPLLGVGLAFLAELLDPTLRSLFDIRRVAPEPVLGTLPLVEKALLAPKTFRSRWVPVTVISVVALTAAFLVAKVVLWPDLGVPKDAIQAVEPSEGGIQ